MNTPIRDFAAAYAATQNPRFHMPGHKGEPVLGCEGYDLTEIDGADDLYHPDGIIAESEANASRLFGCNTFYSTEGSSHCIRTMLFLAMQNSSGSRTVLAARNAHKVFLFAAALISAEVQWLYPAAGSSYHACPITPGDAEQALSQVHPFALYVTSPDYLGNELDIAGLAAVCRRHGVPLLVDNAHGAYLRFLTPSRHPMDLGADLCCDSAHKTLPVLTGGAYLHTTLPYSDGVKAAMALFGSTSPSYLIMQSLDCCNPWLQALPQTLSAFLPHVEALKRRLRTFGYKLIGSEPLKLTLTPKGLGFTGDELAAYLLAKGCAAEFHDPDYLVLMFTPKNTPQQLAYLGELLCAVSPKAPILQTPPAAAHPVQRVSPREAIFSKNWTVPASETLGCICASPTVSCPPAIPIVMAGEQIDEAVLAAFRYYGITECSILS